MTFEELKKNEIPLGKAKDISENKYGMLTPLFRVKNTTGSCVKWGCRCDCGKYVITSAHALDIGDTKTCGNHRRENIIGMKFGEVTVISETDKRGKKGGVLYYCQCSCGEYLYEEYTILKSGHRKKCDNHFENKIIGNKYGTLTILSFAKKKKGKRFYNYQCDCGHIGICCGADITSGHTKTCGNPIHRCEDITNKRFGKLIAKRIDYTKSKNSDGSTFWYCECDCGENITTRINSLKMGRTKSCGCINKSIGEQNIKDILDKNNIEYDYQKTYETCRFPDNNELGYYDFYINNSFLLEFDGDQHSKYKKSGWVTKDNYIKIHNHDLYKNQWAKENNIPIKRIPYKERDNLTLERIMSDEFLIVPETHPQWYPPKDSSYPYFTLKNIDKTKEVS